jgi:hypothetical protein
MRLKGTNYVNLLAIRRAIVNILYTLIYMLNLETEKIGFIYWLIGLQYSISSNVTEEMGCWGNKSQNDSSVNESTLKFV